MNIYDQQLVTDGRILHALGLLLQRDEHGTATPKPLPPGTVCAWCDREQGIVRDPKDGWVSHGICERHLAEQHANIAA